MKRIVLILFLSGAALYGQMLQAIVADTNHSTPAGIPVLISHVAAVSSNMMSVTTSAIDTTGANFIVCADSDSSSQVTPTDSKGNTWAGLTEKRSGDGIVGIRLYYAANAIVGTGHTFTNPSAYPGIACLAFSNLNTSPFDVQNGNVDTSSSNTTQPGSVTPHQANSVVVAALTDRNGNIKLVSVDSPFSFVESLKNDGLAAPIGDVDYIQSVAAAVNPTLTTDFSSTEKISVIAVFKP